MCHCQRLLRQFQLNFTSQRPAASPGCSWLPPPASLPCGINKIIQRGTHAPLSVHVSFRLLGRYIADCCCSIKNLRQRAKRKLKPKYETFFHLAGPSRAEVLCGIFLWWDQEKEWVRKRERAAWTPIIVITIIIIVAGVVAGVGGSNCMPANMFLIIMTLRDYAILWIWMVAGAMCLCSGILQAPRFAVKCIKWIAMQCCTMMMMMPTMIMKLTMKIYLAQKRIYVNDFLFKFEFKSNSPAVDIVNVIWVTYWLTPVTCEPCEQEPAVVWNGAECALMPQAGHTGQ